MDTSLIERVLAAYEIAALEGLRELSSSSGSDSEGASSSQAAAYIAFSLARCLPIPQLDNERIFTVLRVSSIAYCGDRWSDIREYYKANAEAVKVAVSIPKQWGNRILHRLFDCWLRLFRKDGWADLHGVLDEIAHLREEQSSYETKALTIDSSEDGRLMACDWVNGSRIMDIAKKYFSEGDAVSTDDFP